MFVLDLEGKLDGEVGGVAAGDYSGKGADGEVEGMDAGEIFLVKWPVIARRVSQRFRFFSSAMIAGVYFLSLLLGLLRLQQDSSVRLSICLDGESPPMKRSLFRE